MSDGKDDKTRINRVITRSGDDGRTGLADGSRIAKDHPRIQALGALDELNSGLGVLRARALDDDLDALLERVQHLLFDLGGELAVPGTVTLTDDDLVEETPRALPLAADIRMHKLDGLGHAWFDIVPGEMGRIFRAFLDAD